MSAALATSYDRHPMPDETNTADAAAAGRAYAELEKHGGALSRGQIAERWGIADANVRAMAARPGFPKPWLKFGRVPLYLYAEVLAWRRLELERPGRPGPPSRTADAIAGEPKHDVAKARRAAGRVLKHGGLDLIAGMAPSHGITRQALQGHVDRSDTFPAARAFAGGPLYLVAEVDAWFRGRARSPASESA